jgi:hypothetical protein
VGPTGIASGGARQRYRAKGGTIGDQCFPEPVGRVFVAGFLFFTDPKWDTEVVGVALVNMFHRQKNVSHRIQIFFTVFVGKIDCPPWRSERPVISTPKKNEKENKSGT